VKKSENGKSFTFSLTRDISIKGNGNDRGEKTQETPLAVRFFHPWGLGKKQDPKPAPEAP